MVLMGKRCDYSVLDAQQGVRQRSIYKRMARESANDHQTPGLHRYYSANRKSSRNSTSQRCHPERPAFSPAGGGISHAITPTPSIDFLRALRAKTLRPL